MKKPPPLPKAPTDADIRAYAQHLHQQSGGQPGHDLDHWLEAKACLEANIPSSASHARLHHHIEQVRRGFCPPASDASLCIEQEECTGTKPVA